MGMDNMKIGGSLGIFKKIGASKSENKVSNNPMATNPFGLSFKGKLQGSDLFTKSTNSDVAKHTILQRGKMAVSAAVSSLTQIKNTFTEKLGPVIVFAQETGHKISQIADKVSSFKASDLKISNLIKEDPYPRLSKQARKLVTKEPEELESMWQAAMARA